MSQKGVNKVIIVGRLGADPEVKSLGNGQNVATLNVATSESWADKNGQKQERTEWHRVVVWGRQAENVGKYLAKGRQVYVEGRLQTRSWEKDGKKNYITEVVATNVQFLGSGTGGSGGGNKPQTQEQENDYGNDFHDQEPSYSDGSDDIPF